MDGGVAGGCRCGAAGYARRHRWLAVALVVGALLPWGLVVRGATAQDGPPFDAILGVEVPPILGQTELTVFVDSTGHSVGGAFLDYWRATGGTAVFGDPISEPFAADDGVYSQAFENAVFQYRPEAVFTVEPIVRLMPLGRMALTERVGTFRADGRRGGGGGDPLGGVRRSDPAAGYAVSGPFLDWYEGHEGEFYLGQPLSAPLIERGRTMQYFEGGALMGGANTVRLAPLGREFADRIGIETAAVPAGELPGFDEALFRIGENPNPVGDPAAAGPKRIEVDLSEQRIRAFQGKTLVSVGPVSTGLEPNETEQGRFRVRYKLLQEDMQGFTSATGEVVGVIDETATEQPTPAPDAVDRYAVTDVPHVMYVNLDAEALHGAYWHNNFGTPMSHGCINLPLEMAAFLFGWAPIGTPVWVHE